MGEDFHQLHPARGLIFKIFKELKRLYKKLFFITALFIRVRNWKQLICPSKEKWIKKTHHIYTM